MDDSQAGMAILAHHSFPDVTELANGVAIVRENFGQWHAEVVTQRNAVSVTNPAGSSIPEIVTAWGVAGSVNSVFLQQSSNLVVTGGYVMDWEHDYRSLVESLFKVYGAYRSTVEQPNALQLDLINGEPVEWTLRLERIPNSVELASDVTITAEDMKIFLDVSYPASQPEFVWDSELREIVLGTTKEDRSALGVDRMEHALASQSTLQTRTFEDDGVRIETKFYWPPPPVGFTAGYTAPVEQWESTVIHGLIDVPITLTGFWSQTYLQST